MSIIGLGAFVMSTEQFHPNEMAGWCSHSLRNAISLTSRLTSSLGSVACVPAHLTKKWRAAEPLVTPRSCEILPSDARPPTMSRSGATQAKDRLYAQLASRLKNMSRAIGQSADLMEQLQNDLDAMRVLAGTHAAQWVS